MKLKYKVGLVTIGILIIVSLFLVQSYALWLTTYEGNNNILSIGCFDVSLEELSKPISLNNTYPMSDQKGLTQTPYQFTIKNTCNTAAEYTITLNTLKTATMDKSKIKFAFTTGSDVPTSGVNLGTYASISSNINTDLAYLQTANVLGDTLNESIILQKGTLEKENDTETFNLYLWVDQTAGNEVQGQKFLASVNVLANAVTVEPTATETITTLVSGANASSTDVYTVPNKTSDSCTYTLAYDGTNDNNLRYVGANPCNYVTFNGEKAGWRIIGILNTPEGQRMKLIRTNSLGNYSWDNKASGTGSSTGSYGSNDWTDSTLKEVLNNGAYYNKTSGTCPSGQNGATTSCDFTSNGLTEAAKNQIDTITWKLGGTAGYTSSSNGLASHWYTYERGTTVYTGRPTEWQGKVVLMYPSDYGYATSGGTSMNRASCLAKELYSWDGASDCKNNDWLFDSSTVQWTLAPDSSGSNVVVSVYHAGFVISSNADDAGLVRPSVYLISKTSILGGEGTLENPYEIAD